MYEERPRATPYPAAALDVVGLEAPVVAAPTEVEPLARPAGVGLHLFAIFLALLGGVIGVIGAIFEELRAASILLPFLGAPLIEEALKPAGVYVLLIRWPRVLHGHVHTALLAALGGLAFGLIESLIYVTLYVSDPSASYVLFRFTVTPLLHTTASFLVGFGLDRRLIDWSAGRGRFPKRTRNWYAAGVALHATYNTLALILTLTGVLNID